MRSTPAASPQPFWTGSFLVLCGVLCGVVLAFSDRFWDRRDRKLALTNNSGSAGSETPIIRFIRFSDPALPELWAQTRLRSAGPLKLFVSALLVARLDGFQSPRGRRDHQGRRCSACHEVVLMSVWSAGLIFGAS